VASVILALVRLASSSLVSRSRLGNFPQTIRAYKTQKLSFSSLTWDNLAWGTPPKGRGELLNGWSYFCTLEIYNNCQVNLVNINQYSSVLTCRHFGLL
jgi:hypothetical protein